MIITTYRITVRHDAGKKCLIVTTLSGLPEAVHQVINSESCPYRAIIAIRKIKGKNHPVNTMIAAFVYPLALRAEKQAARKRCSALP